MSGICGICQPGRTFDREQLARMLAGTAVSDAETQKSFQDESIALGVSRMFAGQDADVSAGIWVAADTDLLNWKELSATLQAAGHAVPAGASGMLATLYLIYGPDFVHKLDGAFAFALWDPGKRRLMLGIDRLGIKNLYWRADDCLSFATRISALKAACPSLEIDPSALAQFLVFSAIPAPLTIYTGVRKMRPGCTLTLEKGRLKQQQYWDVTFREERRPEREWAELVREELRSSVHRHLPESELEKTGAFLSGGTDSSTVVAFMSERQKPVRTFSIIFNESRYSEENFMRTAAECFGADQHDCRLRPEDAMAAIPRIARYYDEPFANSSAIAAYFCGEMARQCGVNLLLGGDGGDELFAGNQRYEADKHFALYHRVPRALRRGIIEPVANLLPGGHKWLGLPQRYIKRATIPNPQRFFSYNFFLSFPQQEIFEPEVLEQAPPDEWLTIPREHFSQPVDAGELNRLLYLDIKMTLADNDLKKVSGMAELSGIQVRYPLLDYRLADLAGRVPEKLKLRRFEKRYIFKRAMAGILPENVLYKKKHGMGVPISAWLLNDPKLNDFVQDVLHDQRTRQRGYFRPGFVNRLLELQRSEHVAYYGEIVWYLLALELWHREHFDYSERLVCAG
ncbi:MAG: asparagine synthetase B family protein [Actinomycetota bacterium]